MIPCNNSSHGHPTHRHIRHTLIGGSILSFFGLPGNLLVILLIYRAKQKKSLSTYLFLSLAVADIVNLLSVDTVAILVFLYEEYWKKKETLLFWTVPAKIVANFTLAVISLERYDALVKTLKPHLNITKKKILIGVIMSWFMGLVLAASLFIDCTLHRSHSDWHFYLLSTLLLFFGYIVLLVMVLFSYSSIVKSLYFDRTILGKSGTDEASLNENKRLIRTLIAITLVFLACNLPTIIILMLKHHYFQDSEEEGLYLAMVILGCLSSCLNPFIYVILSKKYRNQISELFCRNQEKKLTRRYSSIVCDTKL